MVQKKISQQVTNNIVNENGEILSTETITTKYVEREPDFVKLYISDILKLSDISKGNNDILLALLKRINYENEVFVMSHVKEEIAKELNLKVVTINKAISILSEKNILLRKARGCYLMNPFFFGRGKWENIKKIRMELEYDTDGKHTFRVNIDKESVISIFENEAKKEV
jgi:hypothetical protein